MPAIIARSISILSDAGLGMAMFSLGVHISEQYYIAQCFCRSIMYILQALDCHNFQACSWHCSRGSLPVGTNSLHTLWLSGSSWVQQSWLAPPWLSDCVESFCTLQLFRYTAILCVKTSCFATLGKQVRNFELPLNFQAALPQGIVPFVFAKEYNVHPDILSTA
jgi:hypothetical protein